MNRNLNRVFVLFCSSGPFIEAAAAFVSSGGNFLAQCHGIGNQS